MKLGERKYTQDEGPAQEPWTEAPGKSPRAADGKTGAQDAPRRRGVRGTDTGESACEIIAVLNPAPEHLCDLNVLRFCSHY